MDGSKNLLKELCIEITDRCTLNCLHCSGNCGLNRSNSLGRAEIEKVIDDFAILGGKTLEISGGEPLLHESLVEIVSSGVKHDLEIVLYTSGNLLDKEKTTQITTDLAIKLQRAGLSKIVFNLQGATAYTHESITRRTGSFENTINSIRLMKKLGFWIGVHFVPTNYNCHELEDLCDLSGELLVDEVGLLRLVPQGRGLENKKTLELSKNKFKKLNNLADKLSRTRIHPKVRVGRPFDFRFLDNPCASKADCDAGISRCLVTSDGRVAPCPAFKSEERNCSVGNVRDRGLSDIWSDDLAWREIRRFDYRKLGEPCKSCTHLDKCKGGCKAQRFLMYGNLHKGADPCCYGCSITTTAECQAISIRQGERIAVQT